MPSDTNPTIRTINNIEFDTIPTDEDGNIHVFGIDVGLVNFGFTYLKSNFSGTTTTTKGQVVVDHYPFEIVDFIHHTQNNNFPTDTIINYLLTNHLDNYSKYSIIAIEDQNQSVSQVQNLSYGLYAHFVTMKIIHKFKYVVVWAAGDCKLRVFKSLEPEHISALKTKRSHRQNKNIGISHTKSILGSKDKWNSWLLWFNNLQKKDDASDSFLIAAHIIQKYNTIINKKKNKRIKAKHTSLPSGQRCIEFPPPFTEEKEENNHSIQVQYKSLSGLYKNPNNYDTIAKKEIIDVTTTAEEEEEKLHKYITNAYPSKNYFTAKKSSIFLLFDEEEDEEEEEKEKNNNETFIYK